MRPSKIALANFATIAPKAQSDAKPELPMTPYDKRGWTVFQACAQVARAQQAKSWEPSAAMSMARLWRDQGKRDEARELLAPVYGWFTEG
jgi:hypothetical protein